MSELLNSLIELIRRTSTEMPDDVHQAILASLANEKKESLAANALKIVDQNIALAKLRRALRKREHPIEHLLSSKLDAEDIAAIAANN